MRSCAYGYKAREYPYVLSRTNLPPSHFSISTFDIPVISIPNIESHITCELSASPTPTSRDVDVPLPASSLASPTFSSLLGKYPGAMTIPSQGKRKVHIWNSQPLGSIVVPSSASPISTPLPFSLDDVVCGGSGEGQSVAPMPSYQGPLPTSLSTTVSPSSSSSSLG